MNAKQSPRLRTDSRRKRRGVALLLVLWLVVILASVTMAASSAARSSGALVTARRAGATAQAMAESGVTAAVAAINDSLRAFVADTVLRDAYLNGLDAGINNGATTLGFKSDTLIDGAFATAVVDVASRLDINSASEGSLEKFLSGFTSANDARLVARLVAARVRGDDLPGDSAGTARLVQDSVVRALLGQRTAGSPARHPFETLDELSEIQGLDQALLVKIAPFLTVDGDAVVNRHSAPAAVIESAGGTLADAPTRLLVITRGWEIGNPLTHEIQAVYDVSPNGLVLVRWRERVL